VLALWAARGLPPLIARSARSGGDEQLGGTETKRRASSAMKSHSIHRSRGRARIERTSTSGTIDYEIDYEHEHEHEIARTAAPYAAFRYRARSSSNAFATAGRECMRAMYAPIAGHVPRSMGVTTVQLSTVNR
jgi:hypothetical protein